MIKLFDISRDQQCIEHAYQFLQPHFGVEELEGLAYYLQLSAPSDLPNHIWIAGIRERSGVEQKVEDVKQNKILCAAILDIIPLPISPQNPDGQRVLGAIGHALVDQSLRGKGMGRLLNQQCEQLLSDYAQAYQLQIEALILESEIEACHFWSEVGYRWPKDSLFKQPPLDYDETGHPCLPGIPMFFMIKHPELQAQIPSHLTKTYLRVLLCNWYRDEIPSLVTDPLAVQTAYALFDKTYLQPALQSIQTESNQLVDLCQLSTAELSKLLPK